MRIELKGMDSAVAQMKRIERGSRNMESSDVFVGTRLPYAYGIEHGRHRKSGRLARRAGGAHYLRNSVDTVLSGADTDISEGLDMVTAPGMWILWRLGRWAARLARLNVPRGPKGKPPMRRGKKVYRLRRSIRARNDVV